MVYNVSSPLDCGEPPDKEAIQVMGWINDLPAIMVTYNYLYELSLPPFPLSFLSSPTSMDQITNRFQSLSVGFSLNLTL
jgi:hypothetical protein